MEAASGVSARGSMIGEKASRPALLSLSLAVIAISFTPILFRLSEIGPTATALYRTGLALPILAAWKMVEQHRGVSSRVDPRDGLTLAIGGAVFAANIAAYAWAVHLTAVANASLLSNLSPIFVSLGGYVVFRDRVSRGFVAAMATAIAGVAILASDKLAIGGDHILGDAAALLSAVTFAAYLIIVGRLSLRIGAATVMLWTGIFTALSLAAMTLMSGETMLPQSWRGWAVVLALALFSFAIGQGLLTVALAQLGATFAAVALLCLPVAAAIYGWILLGEALSATQEIGALIILASILGARLASRPGRPACPPRRALSRRDRPKGISSTESCG
jgi:drug/metabolite transporter (DMT)-like permease